MIVWNVNSAYKMQNYPGVIPLNGGSMTLHGCAITLEANILYSNGGTSVTPNTIRSNTSNFGEGGGILFANAASGSGLSTSNTKVTGQLSAAHYNELAAENSTGYYIGIEVNYDGVVGHHHWVGVNGISGDYYIISPTSVNDSATGTGTLRGGQGWTTDASGNILVPISNVTAYQTFSKPIPPQSTGASDPAVSSGSSGPNIFQNAWNAIVDFFTGD